jgi:hypothetical protein
MPKMQGGKPIMVCKIWHDIFCAGSQLLSCSHLVDHTSIPLIFQVNLMDQKSFLGDKT